MMWCCGLTEGDCYGLAGAFWFYNRRGGRVEVGIEEPVSRWLREQGTLHVPDAKKHRTLFQ